MPNQALQDFPLRAPHESILGSNHAPAQLHRSATLWLGPNVPLAPLNPPESLPGARSAYQIIFSILQRDRSNHPRANQYPSESRPSSSPARPPIPVQSSGRPPNSPPQAPSSTSPPNFPPYSRTPAPLPQSPSLLPARFPECCNPNPIAPQPNPPAPLPPRCNWPHARRCSPFQLAAPRFPRHRNFRPPPKASSSPPPGSSPAPATPILAPHSADSSRTAKPPRPLPPAHTVRWPPPPNYSSAP